MGKHVDKLKIKKTSTNCECGSFDITKDNNFNEIVEKINNLEFAVQDLTEKFLSIISLNENVNNLDNLVKDLTERFLNIKTLEDNNINVNEQLKPKNKKNK